MITIKYAKDKNFTTNAGLKIFGDLWNKHNLPHIFNSIAPKHSGASTSKIMQNLFFRNLIDANSMTALSEKDKEEYFLKNNVSLHRTSYERNLNKINDKQRKSILLKFNNNFITQQELDDDTIMIYDTSAIQAEGKTYEEGCHRYFGKYTSTSINYDINFDLSKYPEISLQLIGTISQNKDGFSGKRVVTSEAKIIDPVMMHKIIKLFNDDYPFADKNAKEKEDHVTYNTEKIQTDDWEGGGTVLQPTLFVDKFKSIVETCIYNPNQVKTSKGTDTNGNFLVATINPLNLYFTIQNIFLEKKEGNAQLVMVDRELAKPLDIKFYYPDNIEDQGLFNYLSVEEDCYKSLGRIPTTLVVG